MKKLNSNEVRNLFLEFFRSKDHMIEPGAPLVPIDDDTLLWINSGVAALKKYFDGRVKPNNPRIANVQKSLRTNDIDNVGKTSRHHTFFEMLGNFSIGDYFKEDAIKYAYEFLFSEKWLGLDRDKMYVSVHTEDKEAYDIWINVIGISPGRILKTDDNFWQIGDGPCGPNSEIFYDRGPAYDPDKLGEKLFFEEMDNDRYIEVWNIVFSQYDGKEGVDFHLYEELPQKNIDTGMGFERLVTIVQDVKTNFDSDLFMPIIRSLETMTTVKYEDHPMAYRVIADHIRALVFALGDGALFANDGRGYVLRRLLRRAVRFGRVLNIRDNFMYQLVDVVLFIMNDAYPNLMMVGGMVVDLIHNEEKRFAKTLADGEKLLMDTIQATSGTIIAGDIAFKLYDTYGFPIELTQEIAAEHGYSVELAGFDHALTLQQERARKSRTKVESMGSQQEDMLNFKEKSDFVYDTFSLEAKVVGLFVDGNLVEEFSGRGLVVFDRTCFYAESGGQVADKGVILGNHVNGIVSNVSKANGNQHLHHVKVNGTIRVGDVFLLKIDHDRRVLIRKNHSCVHLLQSALREVVGFHVNQAGSYVDEHYFRFDFTHFEKVSLDKLNEIETKINQWIAQSLAIVTEVMPVKKAIEKGATALFGDVYGELVRVVAMGDVSLELCGGTHAVNTGEIGVFRLVSEESIGSGVRRIVGKAGQGAYLDFAQISEEYRDVKSKVKASSQRSALERIEDMQADYDLLDQKYQRLLGDVIKAKAQQYLSHTLHNDSGLSFVWIDERKESLSDAKELAERVSTQVDVVALSVAQEKEGSFVVFCSHKAIESGIKAGDLAKLTARITGGNGGGRPNFAQAGIKDLDQIAAAKKAIMAELGL